jgi:putative ABC transport system permease protein
MTDYLRALMMRIRGVLGLRKADFEFDGEIQAHLDLLTERYIRQGMTRDEAAAAAMRQFGNVTWLKEVNREMRRIRVIDSLIQDLRYGLRMLRRNPGITLIAVFTLALGIGANTAIFSVVNAVLLRPLPYRDPDRLVLVSHYHANTSEHTYGADFLEWRDQAKSFEQIAAYYFNTADLTGSGEPERLSAGFVSADLFATLGVAPAHGRAFTHAEDTYGGQPAVILSDGLWRRRFGGDPQVIGRSITVANQSRTIVGIMPAGFRFPGESDLWLPLALNVAWELGRLRLVVLNVIARLKPDVTPEAARADISVILERQQQAFPHFYKDAQIRVIGLSERLVGNVRLSLLVLFGAVAFVLLIACANVANLLLARSVARQREMAIRAAVGAGRLRLVRQLLTESLLISLLGGAAGLLAAKWGIKLLVAASPDGIARIEETSVDARVLSFTCLVVLLTSLIAGIFPALQASRTDVNETLKAQSGAGSVRGPARRALPALMITEMALALVLLVGAGLMVKSFLRLMAVPKGFDTEGALTLRIMPSINKYPPRSPLRNTYFEESLERVRHLPGIQSASLANSLPLSGPTSSINTLQIEGRPPFEPGKGPIIYLNAISPEYFQTMGMQMIDGRSFTSGDGPDAQRVAIINETMARQFLANENPIGHRLGVGNGLATIVGIASDTRNSGIANSVNPEIYLARMQNPSYNSYLVVRTARDQNNPVGLPALAAAIRNQVRAIDPNEPVDRVVPMDEQLSNSVADRRFQMLLLGLFAAVALVIATVGIYGVISYAVSQRTREIGIRMALGAQAGDVLRMVIWRGMSLTLIGVALGLAAALALTRVMENLLFEVSATDPPTFAIIALLLVAVAFIASYIPAQRATKVDPLQALRQE